MESYGAVLKNIRKSRRITQEILCEGITSRRTLCNFENDKSLISFDVLCKLLKRLNVDFDEFLSCLKMDEHASLPYNLLLGKKMTTEEYQRKLLKHWKSYEENKHIGEKLTVWVMMLCHSEYVPLVYQDFDELFQQVKAYLFHVEDWKRSEMLLFLAAIEYLDEMQIQLYEEDVYYKAISNSCYVHELSMYFVKRGLTLFKRKVMHQIAEFLARFRSFVKEHPCQMYEYSYYLAFKSLYSLTDHCDHIKFHRAVSAFSSIGFYNEATELLEIFHNY